MAISTIDTLTERLNSVQDRLSMALSAANVGIWDWDLVNGKMVWDARMFDLFGIDPSGFSGSYDDFVRCLIESDKWLVAQALHDSLNNKTKLDITYKLTTVPHRILHSVGQCCYDIKGDPVRFIGVCVELKCNRLACDNRLL